MYKNDQALFLCKFHAENRLFSATSLEVLETLLFDDAIMLAWNLLRTAFGWNTLPNG